MPYRLILPLCAALLAGCQTAAMRDPGSPFFVVPPGTVLELRKPVQVPAGQAHIKFQQGRITGSFDDFTVGCRLNVKDLGPATLEPGPFQVTRSSVYEEWEMYPTLKAFYRTLHLHSARYPGVLNLRCRYQSGIEGRDISLPQIRTALGEYFTIRLPSAQQPGMILQQPPTAAPGAPGSPR